ncbi:DNA processing protein DprA [Psychromicrobium lacuslunae]|uniref:DNA processing protein DprA n=2 Tax=Psychromicrobium lacuslunae TaxID=1618207 RepID=A0A0D4C2K9_9MICC|nr:DNA processing protein DprA [Psychromicrobium lacuslunae]
MPGSGTYLARAALSRVMEPSDLPGLALIRVLGPWRTMRIIADYEKLDPKSEERVAYYLQEQASKQWSGITECLARWRPRLPNLSPRRDLRFIASQGGGLLIPEASNWPTALRDLGLREPIALWYLGKANGPGLSWPPLRDVVALVGARDATAYGEAVTSELSDELVARGKSVISGGAYGIDAIAHRSALKASSELTLPTIAVMAGGLDRFYPSGNQELLMEITRRCVVLAEVPPGARPTRYRFLQRNRLIAALAAVTVVVEARWRSGALSTAHHALDLGREVAAVPGSVYSANSAGCHRLLREGAACVTQAAEVLELMSPLGDIDTQRPSMTSETDGLPVQDLLLLDALPLHHTTSADKLCALAGLPLTSVQAGLGRLEALGLAQRRNAGWSRDHPRG